MNANRTTRGLLRSNITPARMRLFDGPARPYWSAGLIVALVVAFVCLWPLVARAQNQRPNAHTAEQIRAGLQRDGYTVDEPRQWGSDGVVMLSIHDLANDRPGWPALRVFVFPDSAAAAAANGQAHIQDDASLNRSITYSDDSGPRLLSGYGASGWRNNVAVVQLSGADDIAAFPGEPDCTSTDVVTYSGVITPVDASILASLDALDHG
jgi:hypothetical protein